MLISPDNGLVLYERVISTKAEHRLLDKLTKPKYYHPTANTRKAGERKGNAHSGGASSRPGSAAAQPGSGRGPSAGGSPARSPTESGSAAGSGQHPQAHPHAHPHGDAESESPPQRSRSASPSGAPGGTASTGAAGLRGRGVRRKPLYPEEGPLKDYFNKERASVTATTVFTWGNRYLSGTGRVVGGGGGGASGGGSGGRGGASASAASAFPSYTPAQHKPPLRL